MSQAGNYTPIKLYYSTTASAAPSASNLANGELAINITDGKLFYKDNLGSVQLIASKEGASGTVTSVAMTVPTGLSIAGSPVTSSGTLAVTYASGYSIPTDAKQTNWDSAYGWLSTFGTIGQVLTSTGSGWAPATLPSGMVYPGAGIAVSTGTAWTTSLTAPSGAIVGTTDTQTLTNKRITPRFSSTTSWTSPLTWNSDSYDQYQSTAQAGAVTINADAGTPTNGQKMIFRIKDNGTARALTWTTGTTNSFRAIGTSLPTTTVANKILYVGCIYNGTDSRWDVIMVSQEA